MQRVYQVVAANIVKAREIGTEAARADDFEPFRVDAKLLGTTWVEHDLTFVYRVSVEGVPVASELEKRAEWGDR